MQDTTYDIDGATNGPTQIAKVTLGFGARQRFKIHYKDWLRKGEILTGVDIVLVGDGEISHGTYSLDKRSYEFVVAPADEYVGTTRDITVWVETSQNQARFDTISLTTVDGPGNLD